MPRQRRRPGALRHLCLSLLTLIVSVEFFFAWITNHVHLEQAGLGEGSGGLRKGRKDQSGCRWCELGKELD